MIGTPYIYERGGIALANCTAISTKHLAQAAYDTMDLLMCGCGVGKKIQPLSSLDKDSKKIFIGIDTVWDGKVYEPVERTREDIFIIPDSREGWCLSVLFLLKAYLVPVTSICRYDYRYYLFSRLFHSNIISHIRPKGSPLKGFGGTASGPEPLKKLHARINGTFRRYLNKEFGKTRLIADIMNSISCCVIAGNVRRSSMIILGSMDDDEFINLKNYELHPDRAEIGWTSNNSVLIDKEEDIERLTKILPNIIKNC